MSKHVRTTMAYTFPTAAVALLATVATSLGVPALLALPAAALVLCGGMAGVVHGASLTRCIRARVAEKRAAGVGATLLSGSRQGSGSGAELNGDEYGARVQ